VTLIRRILSPVDESSFSERALRHAAALASVYDGELRVVRVLPQSAMGPANAPDRDLEAFVARALSRGGASTLIRTGPVAGEILRHASEWPADLVVMGTHGVSGFRRLLLGSVTEQVVRRASCPVLTVPPHASPGMEGHVAFGTILCAVDFSGASTRALTYALSLAREAAGRLLLLHVLEWFDEEEEPAVTHAFRTSEEDAREELDELLPADVRSWRGLELVVGHGSPYVEVLRVAGDRRADLIVLGEHGRGAIDRTIFGSTAERVVRQATCPVLTVR
jgi:nucleotide-binding universal stress UspA family protein